MHFIHLIAICSLSSSVFALDNLYCAQGNGVVKLGMTTDEVRQACGIPLTMQTNNARIVKKQPITRLSYNDLSQGAVYYWDLNKVYHIFSIPSNQSKSNLTIDIMDNKVKSVYLNGGSINGTGACNFKGATTFGGPPGPTNETVISVGDPVDKVYMACGSPDYQDDTFIEVPIPSSDKPEVWIYKLDSFNPSYRLTFIQGILKGIDKNS